MYNRIDGDVAKTWHPTDFGFYEDVDKPGVYYNGSYQLRRFPEDMWLLRRKKKKGEVTEFVVKFYYLIKYEDYEFANWLLSKRLNKY